MHVVYVLFVHVHVFVLCVYLFVCVSERAGFKDYLEYICTCN